MARAFRAGSPLWTPVLSHGQPLLASPFMAAAYPPNALLALFPERVGPVLSVLTAAHLVWGALGTWLLLRRRSMSPAASWTGAVAFGFCGMSVSGSYMTLLCFTAAWSPWVLLCADRVLSPPHAASRPRAVVLLGLSVAALVASGDPFVAASTFLGCALAALFPGGDGSGAPARRLRSAAAVGGGLLLGLGLSLPLLLSWFRFLHATSRGAGLGDAERMLRSLQPLAALSLVLPDYFGNIFRIGETGYLAAGINDDLAPLFPSLYVGFLLVALAFRGAAGGGRAARAASAWFAASCLLSLGRFLPGNALLAAIPGLSSGRFPLKWLLPGMLPFAILAAAGVDAFARDVLDRGRRRLAVSFVLAAAGPLAVGASTGFGSAQALAVRFQPATNTNAQSIYVPEARLTEILQGRLERSAVRGVLPILGAALLTYVAWRRGRPGLAALGLAAFATLDVTTVSATLTRTVPAAFYSAKPKAVSALLDDGAASGRVWVDGSAESLLVRTLVPGTVTENVDVIRIQREQVPLYTGASYGLPLAFSLDLPRLATRPYEEYRSLVESAPARERSMLLRAASVTHVVSPLDRGGPDLKLLLQLPGLYERPLNVYRVDRPIPPFRKVRALRVHDGPADFERLLERSPDDVLEEFAFVERGLLPRAGASGAERPLVSGSDVADAGEAHLVERTATELIVETRGPAGILVVAETWAPGWSARVDGNPAPLIPVNLAFRGVPVPPGPHRVVFRYSAF